MTTISSMTSKALMARRQATLGPHSVTFYSEPLHLLSGKGVWLRGADGVDYLDAYNNVPHVGHCNPVVVRAIADQAARLNVNTRYLFEPTVEYAEMLLATFADHLDRVLFTNSGSESNELALRMTRQHSGSTGIIVSDFSYHGNTISLAEATTGIPVKEPLGPHVRALPIPDLDSDARPEATVLAEALDTAAEAIASLQADGHGVSALLFDPLFSTEGLLRLPAGYISELADMVRAAGGLVIADEVQSGFGRSGTHFWGHELLHISPDIVTLGKPMGNGHPLGAAVTTAALNDEFGSANLYFNTFAGNPVSSAAGMAVLTEMTDRQLQRNARQMGTRAREILLDIANGSPHIRCVKGTGLFFGLEFSNRDGKPLPVQAKWVVEQMRRKGVLISTIGPNGNVLKIRPPMVFDDENLNILTDRLGRAVEELAQAH